MGKCGKEEIGLKTHCDCLEVAQLDLKCCAVAFSAFCVKRLARGTVAVQRRGKCLASGEFQELYRVGLEGNK